MPRSGVQSRVMRPLLQAVALSLFVSALAHAQAGTDFTGRWTLEVPTQAPAETPLALSVRQSVVSVNVRGEPMTPFFRDIAIERALQDGTRSETRSIGIVGGLVGGRSPTGGPGLRTSYSTRWDGNTLVFENRSDTESGPEAGEWTERRETWSLDSRDRLHVTIATRSSSDPPRTIEAVYRRQ